MKPKYGHPGTYKHEMSNDYYEYASAISNRSKSQTLFLFQLVDGDFNRIIDLEVKIKKHFVAYCPDTKEEVERIMNIN